jgi:hypothetical protein
MPTCVRCGSDVGAIVGIFTFNKKAKRCSECEKEVRKHLESFRKAFNRYIQDGFLSAQELAKLQGGLKKRNIDWDEAIFYIRHEALDFLEQILASATSDGVISDDGCDYFQNVSKVLSIPHEMSGPLFDRYEQVKLVTNAQKELMEQQERYKKYKESKKAYKSRILEVLGDLGDPTKEKLSFIVDTKEDARLAKKKISQIKRDLRQVKIEIIQEKQQIRERDEVMQRHLNPFSNRFDTNLHSGKKSRAGFSIADHVYQSELHLIDQTLLKLEAVLIEVEESENSIQEEFHMEINTRYPWEIPQYVKTAVWERDQGKCVQCGDTKQLEFDHKIPYNKGGGNSINNLQLLCVECKRKRGELS